MERKTVRTNRWRVILISNFRRVLNVVCSLLGDSLASEFYMPKFRNILFHLHRQVGACRTEMEQTECSETSAYKIQTPGNHPKESIHEVKSDHIRFFLSLRAAFFSSSSNINAIAANCLLENEWGCIIDGDKRGPRITCYAGRWLNTTDNVNTDQCDGMERERLRNGNVT